MLHLHRDSGIGPVLKVENTGGGFATRGIDIKVPAGQSPINVSKEAGRASNLNADEVDGKDSTAFFSRTNYGLFRSVSGEGGGSAEILEVNCDPGDMVLSGGGGSLASEDHLSKSIPTGRATGWQAVVRDNGIPDFAFVSAVCADFPPLR